MLALTRAIDKAQAFLDEHTPGGMTVAQVEKLTALAANAYAIALATRIADAIPKVEDVAPDLAATTRPVASPVFVTKLNVPGDWLRDPLKMAELGHGLNQTTELPPERFYPSVPERWSEDMKLFRAIAEKIPDEDGKWMKIKPAAKELGVSDTTIANWIEAGKLFDNDKTLTDRRVYVPHSFPRRPKKAN